MRITCRNVSRHFETRDGPVRALEDMSFSAGEGEFLCILGPSGCGKTTLLRILGGVLEPSAGEVTCEGGSPQDGPATALVFQEHGVFPWLTVLDNVCFALEARSVLRKARHERAMPLVERLGLASFATRYPHQLSAGMKQRVGIARALVSGAGILLMDEPFASLDAQMRLVSLEQLLEVHREYRRTVVYVTHDIDEALLLADRVVLMTARPGRVRDVITVDLPRPRGAESRASGEFARMKAWIWSAIRDEVERGMEASLQ